MQNLIEVRNLEILFHLKQGTVRAVNGVDLEIKPNRTLGLVGESGCGKSMTAKAIMRILPRKALITSGQILLNRNEKLARLTRGQPGEPLDLVPFRNNARILRAIRGGDMAMIFQEPMSSLSPVHTIGNQIREAVMLHQGLDKHEARRHVVEMLKLVGIPMAERRFDAYPHNLSGGLRQRAMIAMALSCQPRLLVADEPTTALDVTIQSQILKLIERLQRELNMAMIMITHDLGVVAETADEVAVMYLGRVVERAPTLELYTNAKHPYTQGLLRSVPKLGQGHLHRLDQIPGSVPDPFTTPPGCPFHPRCPEAIPGTCDVGAPPPVVPLTVDHQVACHLYQPPRDSANAPLAGPPTLTADRPESPLSPELATAAKPLRQPPSPGTPPSNQPKAP